MINEITYDRFKSYLMGFTRGIDRSFKNSIQPKFIPLHVLMIIISIPLVISGFDWKYFLFFRENDSLFPFLFPAVIIGGLLPFCIPPVFYLYGKLNDHRELETLGYALTQTAVVGLFWSALYKAFTGREGPEFRDHMPGIEDYSQNFYFGLLVGGVFDGWPSGHTTISVALAICFYYYRPDKDLMDQWKEERNWVTFILRNRGIALYYALYVGFGISTNIHWFSDFIAGLILGYCVGKGCAEVNSSQWMNENTINTELLSDVEGQEFDIKMKITFGILGVIIFFSIFIPREFLPV